MTTLRLLPIFAALVFVPASGQAEEPLPTPKDHYQHFDTSQAGLKLFTELMGELDPATQKLLLEIANSPDASTLQKIPRSEVLSAVRSVNWQKWKAPTLEILLHHSNVLDAIPAGSKEWVPIVHDALLYFLDRLDSERLLNRLVILLICLPAIAVAIAFCSLLPARRPFKRLDRSWPETRG